MKNRLMFVIVAGWLAINAIQTADAQQNRGEHVIADFEGEKAVAGNKTTHKANVSVVKDAPAGGGKSAAKTVVDSAAQASKFFGTGFRFSPVDLSATGEIKFWIKTDIESGFSFQIHSDDNRASVFRFSTVGSKPGTWKQITAPLAKFNQPPWSKGMADLTKVNKIQVTAFGSGPYDGKYIILDHVVSAGQPSQPTDVPSHGAAPVDVPDLSTIPVVKSADLDRFGGWKGKSFEASGYFRTVHDGKRWWLVTPEGNAFLSFGINHYHASWWAQDYNRDHWLKVFGGAKPMDLDWQKGFRDRAVADCNRLGINTLGFHSETPALIEPPLGPVMPYIRQYEPVRFSFWRRPKAQAYVDVFSPQFEEICDMAARKSVAPYANDPLTLGFAMADIPIMSDSDSQWSRTVTWPRVLRNLGADAPGKQAYVSMMRQRHADINAFNAAYSTDFSSWDNLAAAKDWRPKTDFSNETELADNIEFLRRCVDRYYTVARAVFRRYDSNHMFLGDKLNANDDSLGSFIDITSRHTDVILIQCYGRWNYQKPRLDRWSSKVDKPFLNGDSSYGVPNEMMPNPLGTRNWQASTQAERAFWTLEFAESAFARPDFVGWHICGIIDTWKTMPGKAQRQHCGIMTPTGEFYPEMEHVVRDLSSRLYRIGTRQEKRNLRTPLSAVDVPHDYSGRDLEGIKSIVEQVEHGSEQWRKDADLRIDQLRKAELVIEVVDENGKPRPGVPVHVQLNRHLFRFGGIVGGASMHEPAQGAGANGISPEQYKKMFLELGFNTAGFNKYLKYKQRPRSERHLPALFAWFQEHDIPVRGHCLMWPGGAWMNFMPPELSELVYVPDPTMNWSGLKKGVPRDKLTTPEKRAVRDLCEKMVEEASRQWPVFEWDVINETRANHIVQDLIGKNAMVDWFITAQENTNNRNALLYLNENRVISDPAQELITQNIKHFEGEVRYLLDNGAPITGLGFQSRFHTRVPPETILKRLNYFEEFDLPIAATEFEMDNSIGDEYERAAMTERVMTVYFSHKLVNGIYAWSLLAQDHGGPGHRAILEDDGALKLRGKVWMYLMKNRWWTDETLTSDDQGIVSLRGFKGDYTVTCGEGEARRLMEVKLTKDQKLEVILKSN